MTKIKLFGLAALLAMAVACGGSKGDADKTAQGLITMMENLGKVAKENQEDCGKMADEMAKIIDSNKGLIEDAKKMKGGSEEDQKKMMEKYGDKMMAAAMGMMPAMKCANDPKMAELNKKMDFMK